MGSSTPHQRAQFVHPFPIQPTKKKTIQYNTRTTKDDGVQKAPRAGSKSPTSSTRVYARAYCAKYRMSGQSSDDAWRTSIGTTRPRSDSWCSQSYRMRSASARGWRSVSVSSRFQEANRQAWLVEGAPDPDVMPDLDADAVASAGPALMLGPARPRKTTGKNPTSTPPRVTWVAHGNACINAMAVPAFDALFRTRVSTRGKRGRHLLTFSSGADEDDG